MTDQQCEHAWRLLAAAVAGAGCSDLSACWSSGAGLAIRCASPSFVPMPVDGSAGPDSVACGFACLSCGGLFLLYVPTGAE